MSVSELELLPETEPIPVAIGEVVAGKYRIERVVGTGGMATVVAAHHLELDQPVAIKLLLAENAVRADSVRRFLAEARAAARLESPHVVRVLDVGTAETSRGRVVPFMVMELLSGRDLDGLLAERGRLPVVEAVEYVLQACDAVAEAHALGIIHRDLKPGNLFLTVRRDGTPILKLLDFGISKSIARNGKDAHAMTADREVMGSPGYMSPEQVRSAKDVDARSDIWALGVVLHELLTGEPPFQAPSMADLLVEILHAPPRPLARLAPDVPPPLVDVVMRCLQKTPENRFANIAELVAALKPFRSPVPLVVPVVTAHVVDPPVSVEAGASIRTLHEVSPKRRTLLTALLAMAAVGLVLTVVAVFAKARRSEDARGAASSRVTSIPASVPDEPTPVPPPTAVSAAPLAAETASSEVVDSTTKKRPRGVSRPASPPPVQPKASATATGGTRHRTDW